jgi:signal transduction histidine kinase
MTILVIILVVVAAVLGIAYYFQLKASHKQAEEQQQLLTDYQRRVDEQQKLLDDYRALEKNFDNIGEGYEQALLAFDKMEEEKQKQQAVQQSLEQRCAALQQQCDQLTQSTQRQAEGLATILADMQTAAKGGDQQMAKFCGRISDLGDVDSQQPIERTDNIMVSVVADEAVRLSGIDRVQYLKFETSTAPDAAYTMLSTNQQKAVRALTHLLDNALKFTTDGSVKLSVAVDMDKMQAVYSVEDTGSGIEPADADRIFEPYVKLNQYFDGQGIGLTVARNIARRLGGDVTLDTQYAGPGARFVLALPI